MRCLITQAALGKEVVQNHSHDPFLATQVLRVVDLMEGFFGGIVHVLGSLFFLSHTYLSERCKVLPSTSNQVRGMSGELL